MHKLLLFGPIKIKLYDTFETILAAAMPFRVGVHFDNDEYLPSGNSELNTADGDASTGETTTAPGGIIGMY